MSKPRGQPIRNSGVGTAHRSLVPRLSTTKTSKPPGTSESNPRRRSSSADQANIRKSYLNPRRATSGNRSPSLSHTPLAPKMSLNSLANSCSSSVRGSGLYGRESMSPYHREMAKGVVKDTRPLSDKMWQTERAREIIDFCRENGFPGVLNLNSLPLKTNDFRNLFEFLYSFLEPDFKMPKNQDMAVELPPLLKAIGYPGTVSKSTFQTIGATHSWPMTIGVLHYLYVKAKAFTIMEKDAFQNFDDPIQGESERIIFNYFSRRYNKWMEGDEDDMEDLKLLKRDFMKLHEIDPIRLADLENKLSSLKKENEALKLSTIDLDSLSRSLAEKRSDVEKVNGFIGQKAEQYERKKDEKLALDREKIDLENKKRLLSSSIAELERFCIQEKGIDPNEGSSIESEVAELQRQLRMKQNSLSEANSVLCKTEQELSKRNGNVDKLCEQFNISLLNLKVENLVDLRLVRGGSFEHVREKLQDCFRDYRALEKSLRERITHSDAELASLKKALNKKNLELQKIEDELRIKQEEFDLTKKDIDKESIELGSRLEEAKKELIRQVERPKKNLRTLESQLKQAKSELKFMVGDYERKLVEAEDKVKTTENFAFEEAEKLKARRNSAMETFKEKADEVHSIISKKKQENLDLHFCILEKVKRDLGQ